MGIDKVRYFDWVITFLKRPKDCCLNFWPRSFHLLKGKISESRNSYESVQILEAIVASKSETI